MWDHPDPAARLALVAHTARGPALAPVVIDRVGVALGRLRGTFISRSVAHFPHWLLADSGYAYALD